VRLSNALKHSQHNQPVQLLIPPDQAIVAGLEGEKIEVLPHLLEIIALRIQTYPFWYALLC
jgi:hypothetical protein